MKNCTLGEALAWTSEWLEATSKEMPASQWQKSMSVEEAAAMVGRMVVANIERMLRQ